MQNASSREPTGFEVGVACAVSVPLGIAAIFGIVVIVVVGMGALVLVPVPGYALWSAGASAGLGVLS